MILILIVERQACAHSAECSWEVLTRLQVLLARAAAMHEDTCFMPSSGVAYQRCGAMHVTLCL